MKLIALFSFFLAACAAPAGTEDGGDDELAEPSSWRIVLGPTIGEAERVIIERAVEEWKRSLANVCPSTFVIVRGDVALNLDAPAPAAGVIEASVGAIPAGYMGWGVNWHGDRRGGARIRMRVGDAESFPHWQFGAHELGHAFGLDHAPTTDSIMYENFSPTLTRISEQDARAYAARWCPITG